MLNFETYLIHPKHIMVEHLRVISSMIYALKIAGNKLNDDPQILVTIL